MVAVVAPRHCADCCEFYRAATFGSGLEEEDGGWRLLRGVRCGMVRTAQPSFWISDLVWPAIAISSSSFLLFSFFLYARGGRRYPVPLTCQGRDGTRESKSEVRGKFRPTLTLDRYSPFRAKFCLVLLRPRRARAVLRVSLS